MLRNSGGQRGSTARRMPGHMNVLLAEADVPYEPLAEMDEINPSMVTVDVAIVIGANDVVNPAARTDESSPIFGMPIIDAGKACIFTRFLRGSVRNDICHCSREFAKAT